MHESMFVANLQTRDPPVFHVRMLAAMIGHVDRTPAAQFALILVVEIFQAMQVVQIPLDRGLFTVDFERVESLVACGRNESIRTDRANRSGNGTGTHTRHRCRPFPFCRSDCASVP